MVERMSGEGYVIIRKIENEWYLMVSMTLYKHQAEEELDRIRNNSIFDPSDFEIKEVDIIG